MALRTISTSVLRRELARRENVAPRLKAEHAKLTKRLAAITAELAELGAEPPARQGRKPGRSKGSGRKPGRPKGNGAKLTLPAALAKGVKPGQVISPTEAGRMAKAAGYSTSSKTFGVAVSAALAKSKDFRKIGRGQYQRVSGGGTATAKAKPGRKAKKAGRKPGRPKGSKNKPKAAAPAKAETAAA